ncbi:MAG: glyoxylate reductase [Chloroflexi bacterium]|jgi:glyoxylate reductase|nr:MAG: glyoxylate reductase [Chloroflexota bacterium]
MLKPRVFVTRRIAQEALDLLQEHTELVLWPKTLAPPNHILLHEASLSHGILTTVEDTVDAALIDASPSLKVISQIAVGYDNVDVAAATERGIPVGNTPGVLSKTTADLAFALLMAVARRVVEGDRYVRQGKWLGWHPSLLAGADIHDATLGIVGLGKIGLEMARRGRGFDMNVLYNSRTRAPEIEAEHGLTYVPELINLLGEADFVSLHVPLTSETRHLIGEVALAAMKPTAFLINTTRGPVVDQGALYEALKSGVIAGAALDVTDPEPMDVNDPLLTLENVVVAPHIGSSSVTTRTRMAMMAAENLLAGLRGDVPTHCVNRDALGARG